MKNTQTIYKRAIDILLLLLLILFQCIYMLANNLLLLLIQQQTIKLRSYCIFFVVGKELKDIA
jgi:lipopolysaccharide/colanic/teichoic acid biosynthesis glycosyltransferase